MNTTIRNFTRIRFTVQLSQARRRTLPDAYSPWLHQLPRGWNHITTKLIQRLISLRKSSIEDTWKLPIHDKFKQPPIRSAPPIYHNPRLNDYKGSPSTTKKQRWSSLEVVYKGIDETLAPTAQHIQFWAGGFAGYAACLSTAPLLAWSHEVEQQEVRWMTSTRHFRRH